MKVSPALPLDFVDRIRTQLGDQSEAFISSLGSPLATSVHLHPSKGENCLKEYLSNSVPWYAKGYYLRERPIFTLDPCFHAGGYYVQEASSMVVGQIFKALSEKMIAPKVLDLCAAPGGKSTLCLSGLEGRGLLVSNETIQSRVASLVQNIDKWGFSNVVVTSSDPEKFDALPNFFDVVLVDAPCSGEGLFRKDANSMTHWSKDLAHQCSLRQNRILQHAAQTLRPGGFLIYSTCTFNPEENIVQIQHLCKQQFEPMPLESLEPAGWVKISSGNAFGYQGYPHLIQGEGLFVSVLRKPPGEVSKLITSNRLDWLELPQAFKPFVDMEDHAAFFHKENYFAIPLDFVSDLEMLSSSLRIVKAGIKLGQLKNHEVIPDHHLALSSILHPGFPSIEYNLDDAIHFLKKDNLPNNTTTSGYYLAKYQGLALGWLKSVPHRLNNLYPLQNRIMGNFEKRKSN